MCSAAGGMPKSCGCWMPSGDGRDASRDRALWQQNAGASKRSLRRLLQRKQLRLAGTVALKDGRPQHVFCRSRWVKADALLHEVQISRLCFRIHADEIRRGPGEVDKYLRPDAEVRIGGQRYLLEIPQWNNQLPGHRADLAPASTAPAETSCSGSARRIADGGAATPGSRDP